MQRNPFLLLILDGWGYSENANNNAIVAARTPVWDRLWADYPHTLINTSGLAVGLPEGQMGNSEVGHMNLGAGRVVYQEFTRITRAVETGEIADNPALGQAIDKTDRALHILGLLSPGGVHSHQDHMLALAEMAVKRTSDRRVPIYIHAFLDGRDTPPQSAVDYLERFNAALAERGLGDRVRIASLVGRYYAMDRDQRWDRIQAAYQMLTDPAAVVSDGRGAPDVVGAIQNAYQRGETDEFVQPTVVGEPAPISDGDSVIFANFRADRARQLTRAFTEPEFDDFDRRRPQLAAFVCMTEYYQGVPAEVAFAPADLHNSLGEIAAAEGLRQLRIAETEKYAHVTFFFNGGREQPFSNEERALIPSPKVKTYDLAPAMSADALTDKLVEAIEGRRFELIICNYANPDMVGHTGVLDAAVQAVETVDHCLGRIVEALLRVDGEMLLTADHGNLEQMRDPDTDQPHTAHTTNPVPLLYVGRAAALEADGALCDVAPTVLRLLDLPQPPEMTGRALAKLL